MCELSGKGGGAVLIHVCDLIWTHSTDTWINSVSHTQNYWWRPLTDLLLSFVILCIHASQQVLTIILLIPNLHLSMTTKTSSQTSPSTQQLLQSRQISVEANRFLHYNIQPSDVEILYICFVNIYQLLTHCDLGGSTSWLVDILLERILCMYSHCILAIYLDV